MTVVHVATAIDDRSVTPVSYADVARADEAGRSHRIDFRRKA